MPIITDTTALILISLVLYFGLVIFLARVFSRKIENLKDFFLAGRSLGALPVGMTFAASWFGAGSTIGSVNKFNAEGLSALWYLAIPSAVSCLVITLLMARRVARQTQSEAGPLSQPEAIEKHYGPAGRMLLSMIILLSVITFIASQMVAAGRVFEGALGIDTAAATVIATAVVVAYAMMGGYFAVVVTDMAQLAFIALSLLALAVFAVGFTGSQPDVWANYMAAQPAAFWSPGDDLGMHMALTASFVLAWVIAPEMWQRMSSTRNEHLARQAGWVATAFLCLLFVLITLIGMLSPAVIGQSDNALIDLAYRLPHPLLTALVFIGFASAVTSTMDSSINVGSLTLAHDIYGRLIRPGAGKNHLVLASRIATVLIVIPALVIALRFQDIFHILWMSADIYASAMFFPIVGMLYVPNPGRLAGVLSMAFGLTSVALTALIQYAGITPPFLWPDAPYSTLLGVAISGLGFGIGYLLRPSHIEISPHVRPESG